MNWMAIAITVASAYALTLLLFGYYIYFSTKEIKRQQRELKCLQEDMHYIDQDLDRCYDSYYGLYKRLGIGS